MTFHETRLPGAFLVELDKREDERGFFARSWCAREFRDQGLSAEVVQCSVSFNARRGTLRGMHWQRAPHGEAKLIRCTHGAAFDVIVDLRPGSPTFRDWLVTELRAPGHTMLFVPEGFAHGFQTLEDGTELFYQMSATFHPESAAGFRFDDPALAIPWPVEGPIVSEKDRALPLLAEAIATP